MTNEAKLADHLRTKAAAVCRHADPRCIDDPCPYGVWRFLCDPTAARNISARESAQ